MAANPSGFFDGYIQTQGVDDVVGTIGALSVTEVIASIISWLLGISAVLALLVLVVGGVFYIISLGDESRAERGKKMITYAVMGLLVIGFSYAILAFIKKILTGAA